MPSTSDALKHVGTDLPLLRVVINHRKCKIFPQIHRDLIVGTAEQGTEMLAFLGRLSGRLRPGCRAEDYSYPSGEGHLRAGSQWLSTGAKDSVCTGTSDGDGES